MTWKVKFCKECGAAFDVRPHSRSYLCEECRAELHHRQVMDWRARNPERHRAHGRAYDHRRRARA